MSYMYNSLNHSNYNGSAAEKKVFFSGSKDSCRPVVSAPSYIPKYSIENELQKKDDYRKNIQYGYCDAGKKNSSNLTKIALVSSAAAIALLAMSKK